MYRFLGVADNWEWEEREKLHRKVVYGGTIDEGGLGDEDVRRVEKKMQLEELRSGGPFVPEDEVWF